MKAAHMVAWILLIVGGLNWGLKFLGWDIETWGILPGGLISLVYLLVGVSAIFELFTHKKSCKHCMAGPTPSTPGSTM